MSAPAPPLPSAHLSPAPPLPPHQGIAPGPRATPFWAVTRLQRDPLTFLMNGALEYGHVVRFRVGAYTVNLASHPDDIKHVLLDNHRNYVKSRAVQKLKYVIGNGLVASEGEFWLRQRKLMQPAFHRQRISAFAKTMAAATEEMLDDWDRYSRDGRPIDAAEEMMRLTLRVIGLTMFGADVSRHASEVGRALTYALRYVNQLTYYPDIYASLPLPANRRFRQAVATLDRVIYGLIEQRRQAGDAADRGDLLSLLLAARDEDDGSGMTDRQVRDEAMTIFLAGHETTATLLAWTWYLLSQHVAVAQRLRAELEAMLDGRTPTLDDLPNLPYTRQVLDETLRLYPPAWATGRRALAEDQVGGYRVAPGEIVIVSPYVTHHHPALWPNPEGFDPERFTPESSARRHRFAYFPFGGGPRQCIGNTFALTEAQIILATVAQRYQLELLPGQRIEPAPHITLRPSNGMRVHLRPVG